MAKIPIFSAAVLATVIFFSVAPSSKAADITSTIGLFDEAPNFSGSYPTSLTNLGDFTFSLPAGFVVGSVTISGTFGNEDVPGSTNVTADSDYYVNGVSIEVAACDSPNVATNGVSLACDAGNNNDTPTPWSYVLTTAQLAAIGPVLATGSLDFNVIQNYYGAVETGPITLDIAPTPEPASIALISLGMTGIALLRLRLLRLRLLRLRKVV